MKSFTLSLQDSRSVHEFMSRLKMNLLLVFTFCIISQVSQFQISPNMLVFRVIWIKSDMKRFWNSHDETCSTSRRCVTGWRPPVKYFYWPFQGGASFVDHLYYVCLVLYCFHARLFVDALWSPAGIRADLLALVCDILLWRCHFPIGILVKCGAWLYLFMIFAIFLILIQPM